MPYFIFSSTPGPVFFRGNEIRAESKQWTEVSKESVDYGTFNSLKRIGMCYVVQTDTKPTYDPTHPDNKARVLKEAPGNNLGITFDSGDGSMNPEELKAYLAKKNSGTDVTDKVAMTDLSSKTQKITFDNLDEIGQPNKLAADASPFEGPSAEIAAPTLTGVVAEVLDDSMIAPKKKAAAKKTAKAEPETPAAPVAPQDLGAWS